MDPHELFINCRKGNLDRVRTLIEQREVDVNSRDKWDSTPLYYACLCGHKELVQYLLHNGARCSPSTFDGERCIYGALTPEIRALLTDSNVLSAQTRRRRPFDEFLRRLLETGEHSDVTFNVHGRQFVPHRCVLSARCAYFSRAFRVGRWRKSDNIDVTHPLATAEAFAAVLQFIYTGATETSLSDIDDVQRLAKQLRLAGLQHSITELGKRAAFFRRTKPTGGRVQSICVCPADAMECLRAELCALAESALPSELRPWPAGTELPSGAVNLWPDSPRHNDEDEDERLSGGATSDEDDDFDDDIFDDHSPFADVIFEVDGRLFWCHKLDDESEELIYDVLIAADLCLLPGLKRHCGGMFSSRLNLANCVGLLRVSRLFELARLEDACYQFLAENLDEVIDLDEFQQLVVDDAAQVRQREDVDSIDVIDQLRFHLTAGSIDEAHDKGQLIDQLLEQLDLDA